MWKKIILYCLLDVQNITLVHIPWILIIHVQLFFQKSWKGYMKIATATIIQWNLKSPLSAQISTICTNLHYLHKSPISAQISTICTNLHYLHKSRLSAQISTICTNIHYLHKYTLSAQIYTISILSAQILVFQNWGFPDFPGCKSSIKFLSIWLPDSLFKRYNTIFLFYI